MVRRSGEEWRGLFAAHAASGMTERKFCEERGVCPKHFNLRKKQLGWGREGGSPFVRVQQAPAKEVGHEGKAAPNVMHSSVLLRVGRYEWEFRGVSGDWVVSVMKALA